MSFIALVSEEQAVPDVKRVFEQVRAQMGLLPNYFQAIGRSRELTLAQAMLDAAAMEEGALSKKMKQQLGVVVSGKNTSSYCVTFHMEILRMMGLEKKLSHKLATNPEGAAADEKTKALYRFAEKLTKQPDLFEEADAKALQAAGWSEQEMFEAVIVIAYFNLANRVSIGPGLVADF